MRKLSYKENYITFLVTGMKLGLKPALAARLACQDQKCA